MNNGGNERSLARIAGEPGPECDKGERSEPEGDAGPGVTLKRMDVPDPQVLEKPERRRFTVEYKASIVREADACTELGQIGALLRREGLYSSQLTDWRRAYQKGALAALRDDKRGRKQTKNPLEAENERLKKQNAQLEKRLAQAEAIIDIQKKLSQILGVPLKDEGSE